MHREGHPRTRVLPRPGLLARVRNRLAVVSDVVEDAGSGSAEHLVELSYVDYQLPSTDSVVWSLEHSAHVIEPKGLPDILGTGPMSLVEFEALKRSVRWGALNCYWSESLSGQPIVAPFLGGVQVEDYQLIPLARTLGMPRVTLALFDDVGLGKTIEAGLVIGELIRRRRIRRILVLCPASLRVQWQGELESKFGLDFALVDRGTTQQLRRQFGMETNPWTAHPRAIASYHHLKQEDVLSEFLTASRAGDVKASTLPWDLLIVDEVHNCMPAPSGPDSDLSRMLERIGRLFEHKVFLSATPHNGFTQSFTGLLSLLDPVRFTQKDKITADERNRVGEVVVRRLKRDVNEMDLEAGREPRFTERVIKDPIELDFETEESALINAFEGFRRAFKSLVAASMDPATRVAGNFVIEVLSKRLLSCPYAFAVSWKRFRQGLHTGDEASPQAVGQAAREVRSEFDRDDEYESKLESATRLAGAWSRREVSRLRPSIDTLENALLGLGLDPDADILGDPCWDARFEALKSLIRDDVRGNGWDNGERLIVFTEYRTTLDYILRRIAQEFPNEPEDRFLQVYGGMDDAQRESVKAAFNDPESAVRVLFATDAASEGANLQETARMVFHYDIPWNPARIDQRIGRLDRHGQSRDVLVYHFTSTSEGDQRFMSRVFKKVVMMREDLGPMNKLLHQAVQDRIVERPSPATGSLLDDDQLLSEVDKRSEGTRRRVRADLESTKGDGLKEREALTRFRQAIDLDADALRETLEVAVATSGEPFRFDGPTEGRKYRFSHVPSEFRYAVNASLRRSGRSDGPLLAVQFAAEDQLVQVGGRRVHRPPKDAALLHLGHPFVRQALMALSVCRFPGSKRHGILSRWTVTEGPLDAGGDALVSVCVEELGVNDLRETFHQWVSVLRFPVVNGELGKRLPYATPAQERAGAKHAPDRANEAQGIWAHVGDQVGEAVKVYARELNKKLADQLGRDRAAATKHQKKLYNERSEALRKQLARDLASKRRELEELEAMKNEANLFSGLEDPTDLREDRIRDAMESERARLRETLDFLSKENSRMMEQLIPKRYALADAVLVYPVTVEIRLPEGRP